MAYEFILGIDVVAGDDGVAAAFAVVAKEANSNQDPPHYLLDLLEERRGFADTEEVADYVQNLLTEKPYVARTVPIVNRTTAVGQDVAGALSQRGLAPVGAVLSAGTSTISGDRDEMGVELSVRGIVDELMMLYHAGRFDLAAQKDRDEATRLVLGIERFGDTGTDESGDERRTDMAVTPDEGPYDAIVVSTALACWLGEEQTFDPTQHLKEAPQGGSPRP